jgi:hypothetical protein
MAAAAAALPLAAVSGCSGLKVLGTPPPPPADIVSLQAAIAAEQVMVDRYRAVLSGAAGSAPALTPVLSPLLTEHLAHLSQLRSRLIVPAGSAASASPAPPGRSAKNVPAAPAAAMRSRVPHAPAALAQLYASISASEATHVPVLSVAVAASGVLPSASARWEPL